MAKQQLVELVPVTERDYPLLYKWSCTPGSPHFLSRRHVLAYDAFVGIVASLRHAGDLWLIETSEHEAIGSLHVSIPRPADGAAWFDIYFDRKHRAVDLMAATFSQVKQVALTRYGVRKISLAVFDFVSGMKSAAGQAGFINEVTIQGEMWFLDRYWHRFQMSASIGED